MNVDEILLTLNGRHVNYLLIGGMNFLLRHAPHVTFDMDIWIEDTPENRACCAQALIDLAAEWGEDEGHWGPVEQLNGDWLARQDVFSVTTRHGPVDVFRSVTGLPSWRDAFERSDRRTTAGGVSYPSLSAGHWGNPMSNMRSIKKAEETKRDRAWDPKDRWDSLQQAIRWADAQREVPRNTARACVAEERRRRSGGSGA